MFSTDSYSCFQDCYMSLLCMSSCSVENIRENQTQYTKLSYSYLEFDIIRPLSFGKEGTRHSSKHLILYSIYIIWVQNEGNSE